LSASAWRTASRRRAISAVLISGRSKVLVVREYHEPLPEYLARHACGVQRLVRLMALCADCHETHHLGLAEQRGRGPSAYGRIGAYNRWTAAHLINTATF
jgi:hypothetical protein